ncbi:MAG TPA: hypothetical protein HPP77_06415 [Candidatus Hydrogenedentes bacterium]|nr:hypothetical protein [Candidatus Hydrogenedentota bacterium]HIJ73845.1 hypothetical protein [Candidatus Hydrogenedentota bacterium]
MTRVTGCILLPVVAGCEWHVIEGTVADLEGEALPGVAVSVEGSRSQAVTDPLGEYSIRYEPGPVVLLFDKTGYTPGRLELEVTELRHVLATPVVLWRLPREKGVYFFQDNKYEPLGATEVERYMAADSGVVYGCRHVPEVASPARLPDIMCHDLPRYNARLCRMRLVESEFIEFERQTPVEKLWLADQAIDVVAQVIDEPKASLIRLQILYPLEPGVYAVHWGALEGRRDLEPRAFLFSVVEPKAAVDSDAGGEADSGAAAD